MRAFIAQHGSALVALAALREHPEAQRNDEQTNSLENPVPHINAPTEFNQDTSNLHVNVTIDYRENDVPCNV
jgi:hypothetical protein